MHRNRVWQLNPVKLRTQRNRILPIEGGDGSTFSMDFTTGVLDSRLTFTRSSDATFINSSGFVQYADANHLRNSTMLVSTQWSQTTTGTGAVTINGDGSVRFNGAGGRSTWLQSVALASGLRTTFSFRVTAFTNTNLRTTDLFTSGVGFTSQQWFYTDTNGTTYSLTEFESLPKTGTNGLGVYSCTATTTATSCNVIFGADCNGNGRFGDVTIRDPQVQYGTVVPRLSYVPNSSTGSAKWDSARFDYDPTTLAPRGLLVEAQVTNLLNWSESFATSGGTNNNWASPNMTRGSGQADPANGTNAIRFTAIAPNATLISSAAIGSSAARTFSVWLRRVGAGTGDIQYTQNNGTDWTTQPITSTWTRYSFTHTADHRVGIRIVTSGNSIEIWGAQLEAGTGASSYIPTGASQATRNRDSATMSLSGDLVGFDRFQYTMLVRGRQNTNSFLTSFARSIRFIGASSEPIGFPVNANTFFGTSRNSAGSPIAEVSQANTLNQNFRFAWSLNANLATATMIGSLNQVPSSANRQNLGPVENFTTFGINTNATDTSYASMTIRDFKFWPVAKTASELNALTAG